MSGIILSSPLPPTDVALSPTVNDLAKTFAARVDGSCAIADDESHVAANALYSEILEFEKALEANRKEVKDPYWKVCTAIDGACGKINEMLKPGRARLGKAILDYETARKARYEAEKRAAEEEARRRERDRIAAEEAERKRQQEQAEFDAPPGVTPPPAPVFEAPKAAPIVPAYVSPPPKSVVKAKVDYQLVIDDPALIPREIAGVQLLLPDEKAIKQLLKSGAKIAGCRLVELLSTAAKGR